METRDEFAKAIMAGIISADWKFVSIGGLALSIVE